MAGRVQPASRQFVCQLRQSRAVGLVSTRLLSINGNRIENNNFLLDGIKAVLEQAGMRMDDLVYVQIFCPDLSLFDHFNRRYRSYFIGNLPARAFIGSGPLLRNGRFEIMAQARKV